MSPDTRPSVTERFVLDFEREFGGTSPFNAFHAGLDEDRADILNAVTAAMADAWKPFDDIIARAQADADPLNQITGRV